MLNFTKIKELLAPDETVTLVITINDKEDFTVSVVTKTMGDKKIAPVIVRGSAEVLQSYFNTEFGKAAGAIKGFSSNADQVIKSMAKAKPGSKPEVKKPDPVKSVDTTDDDDDNDPEDDTTENEELASEKFAKEKEVKEEKKEADLFSAPVVTPETKLEVKQTEPDPEPKTEPKTVLEPVVAAAIIDDDEIIPEKVAEAKIPEEQKPAEFKLEEGW